MFQNLLDMLRTTDTYLTQMTKQVYFDMLDALLAEEKIPDEYHGQIQVHLHPPQAFYLIGDLMF